MRFALIACVVLLTGFAFYSASQTVPAEIEKLTASAVADQVSDMTESDAAAAEQTAALNGRIAELEDANQSFADELAILTADRNRLDQELQGALAESTAAAPQLQELSAANETLNTQIVVLETEKAQIEQLLAEAEADNAALNEAIAQEQARAQNLETELADVATAAPDAGDDGTAALQIAQMQTQLNETDAALSEMTQTAANAEGELVTLRAEIASLTTAIAERENTIEELRADVVEQPTISSCSAATSALFASQKLTFDRGTTLIAETSIPALEALTETALNCADANLLVEIGGHTDSQGGEQSNQTLSEARANAVFAFLEARGVPATAMRVVGYGESDPIADNATPEGRAQNRRITFDWQQR